MNKFPTLLPLVAPVSSPFRKHNMSNSIGLYDNYCVESQATKKARNEARSPEVTLLDEGNVDTHKDQENMTQLQRRTRMGIARKFLGKFRSSHRNGNYDSCTESDVQSGYCGDASLYSSEDEARSVKRGFFRKGKKGSTKHQEGYLSLGQRSEYDNIVEPDKEKMQMLADQSIKKETRIAEVASEYTKQVASLIRKLDNSGSLTSVSSRASANNKLERPAKQTSVPPYLAGEANVQNPGLNTKPLRSAKSLTNIVAKLKRPETGNCEDRLKRMRVRAEKVRSLLPPQLAQFVLPSCVSSDTEDGEIFDPVANKSTPSPQENHIMSSLCESRTDKITRSVSVSDLNSSQINV
ncbi:hypothetical protein Ciccas_009828 [Cichlidogyrus casuarinus]|uniref:Uncharacterized protein n=1 Tax=Cichlidogyrus casuarinus TaxID=1844966 RepID=A0ABD2PXQ9_9PLAT